MNALVETLTTERRRLWEEYQACSAKGVRRVTLAACHAFVDAMKLAGDSERIAFTRGLCAYCLDYEPFFLHHHPLQKSRGIIIPHPLFRDVLFPCLVAGYRRDISPWARWLAQFEQYLYTDKCLWKELSPHFVLVEELLRENLRADPGDLSAAKLLVEKLQNQLDFCVHELPAGLLRDAHDFDSLLGEFELLIERLGVKPQWSKVIVELRQMADAWRDFQASPSQYGSFEEILRARQLDTLRPVLHATVRPTRWG